jgi:AraC-like DNA-binding protein
MRSPSAARCACSGAASRTRWTISATIRHLCRRASAAGAFLPAAAADPFPAADEGETLVTSATGCCRHQNFARWYRYARSATRPRRSTPSMNCCCGIERIVLEPYSMSPKDRDRRQSSPFYPASSRSVARMCDFIADNFLQDIDSVDIAARRRSASEIRDERVQEIDRHDAQQICQPSAGSSYAPGDVDASRSANVACSVAMDSGFGSLSAFNKSFRKLCRHVAIGFSQRDDVPPSREGRNREKFRW